MTSTHDIDAEKQRYASELAEYTRLISESRQQRGLVNAAVDGEQNQVQRSAMAGSFELYFIELQFPRSQYTEFGEGTNVFIVTITHSASRL